MAPKNQPGADMKALMDYVDSVVAPAYRQRSNAQFANLLEEQPDTLRGNASRRIGQALYDTGYFAPSDAMGLGRGSTFVLDVAPGVGDYMAFEEAETPLDYGLATVGAVPGIGDALGLGGSALAIFAGPMARTADLKALDKAKALTEAGTSKQKIWDDTGWFTGADGKWRFEINDLPAKRKPDAIAANKMKDALDHEELYSAYPELMDLSYDEGPLEGYRGVYYRPVSPVDGAGSIGVRHDLDPDTKKSTMLHELQHAVQNLEGFDTGSNLDRSKDQVTDYIRAIRGSDEYEKAHFDNMQFEGQLEQTSAYWKAKQLDSYDHMIDRAIRGSLKPRDILRQSNWYKVSDDYISAAGPMPKKPGFKRDDWMHGAVIAMKNDHLESMNPQQRNAVKSVQEEFPTPRERKNAVARMERKLDKSRGGAHKKNILQEEIDRAAKVRESKFDAYKAISGEAEARNVQERRGFLPETGQRIPPWETQDLAYSEQIIGNLGDRIDRTLPENSAIAQRLYRRW